VGQSHGAKDLDWEPADLVHGRVDRRGIVTSFISNRDLLAGQIKMPSTKIDGPAHGGFNAHEVFPGSRTNTVLPGRRKHDHVHTVVWLSFATGGRRVAAFEIPVNLPDHDVAGLGARGTTVHVQQKDIVTLRTTDLPHIPEEGMLVAGLEIGSNRWQLWGSYNLVEHKEGGFLSRTYQRARHGAGRLARLGQGAVIRIKGEDDAGIQVSVTFRRMTTGRVGGDTYQIQSASIHVPETGGQTNSRAGGPSPFLRAENIGPYGSNETGETTYPSFDDISPPPPPPYDDDDGMGVLDVPGDVLTGAAKATRDTLEGAADVLTGMESRIATPVMLTRTDPENRVHVAALINAVTARQGELKQLFQDVELTADPTEVKQLQTQLTEVARLRSVLENHLATLAAEASGEKELENISSSVHAAISQSHALVEATFGDKMKRGYKTWQLKRWAKTADQERLKAALLEAIDNARSAQAGDKVGAQYIRRAHVFLETFTERFGYRKDPDIVKASVDIQALEDAEKQVKKGKHARKTQRAGVAKMEQEERLRTGQ